MADGFKVVEIKLDNRGIRNLMKSPGVKQSVHRAGESKGRVIKEYDTATRCKAIVKESK